MPGSLRHTQVTYSADAKGCFRWTLDKRVSDYWISWCLCFTVWKSMAQCQVLYLGLSCGGCWTTLVSVGYGFKWLHACISLSVLDLMLPALCGSLLQPPTWAPLSLCLIAHLHLCSVLSWVFSSHLAAFLLRQHDSKRLITWKFDLSLVMDEKE